MTVLSACLDLFSEYDCSRKVVAPAREFLKIFALRMASSLYRVKTSRFPCGKKRLVGADQAKN